MTVRKGDRTANNLHGLKLKVSYTSLCNRYRLVSHPFVDLTVLKARSNEIVAIQPEIALFGSLKAIDVSIRMTIGLRSLIIAQVASQ